jgi:hypothetical protein
MLFEDIRSLTVLVNQGSGFLFQPSDLAYTYVLTSKHVIVNGGDTIVLLKRFVRENQVFLPIDIEFTINPGVNYFQHPDLDVAILKIDLIDQAQLVRRTDSFTEDRHNYILAGYPQKRRHAINDPSFNNAYRVDEGITIQGPRNNSLREAHVPDRPDLDEIMGHSGGGIGKISGEHFLLAGIQSQMVNAVDEQLGRIEFSPLSSFDALIKLHPGLLSPLLPAHLTCFSFFQEASFLLRVNAFEEQSVAYTRNFLKLETEKIVNSPLTPEFIKNYFGERLLIRETSIDSINGTEIWVAWLELLTILNVLDTKDLTQEVLDEIFSSVRLLYSATKEDWTNELQNIIYSDYHGLPHGGLVVVATNSTPLGGLFEIVQGRIPQISRVTNKKQMRTDDGINFPFDHYRFVHLDCFKNKCILDKLEEYRTIFDEQELINKLKAEYEQYISRNQH